MKIVGNDGKEYKTYEEAEKADKEFENSKNSQVKERKDLSAKIAEADEEYSQAVKKYEDLKKEANKIIEDAQKKSYDILHEGASEIEKASEKRMMLIKEFNEKFQRPYVSYCTGKEAERQYERIVNQISNVLGLLF